MKVCLITNNAGSLCGNFVKKAIETTGAKCTTVVGIPPTREEFPYGDAVCGYDRVPADCDLYFLFGSLPVVNLFVLRDTLHHVRGEIRIVVVDTHYKKDPTGVNSIVKGIGCKLFAMPDLIDRVGDIDAIPFYFPMGFPDIDCTKNSQITICHSPCRFKKMNVKGTAVICEKVGKFNTKFELVLYKTWYETLLVKAKCHIMIDQIVQEDSYVGGLGKSGLEGMALGCLTMTSGVPYESKYFPPPPAIWCEDGFQLKTNLYYYLSNLDELARVAKKQKEWADDYLSFEFVGKHLMQ